MPKGYPKNGIRKGGFKKGHSIKGHLGKKHTDSTKEKMRIARLKNPVKFFLGKIGCLSPNWKDGIYPFRELLRDSFKYRQWRSDIFTRDNFTCIWCGLRSGNGKAVNLQADHIKSYSSILNEYNITTYEEAEKCEELWDINNGRTLCIDCHKKTDTYGRPCKNI